MTPNSITRQHIIEAIDKIEQEGITLETSTKYDVINNGKAYPPKEVMRYANLLANGKKEWNYSGGEPTNKQLTAFGFEIVSKTEEPDLPETEENLVELLKKVSQEDAAIFFEVASQLLRQLKVQLHDERLTCATRINKRFSITIGQRYCLAFIPKHSHPWCFISNNKIESTTDNVVEKFDGNPAAYLYNCRMSDVIKNHMEDIVSASAKELKRTEVSGYRRYKNEPLEKALFDITYKNHLFELAYTVKSNNIGAIWKMGCNWRGNKSYYELVKKLSIVIGIDEKPYAPGDLVLITKGYTVYALTKVLEVPKPVTDVPEFEAEFAPYKIEYVRGVNYAKAEWYELKEEDVFTYQLPCGDTGNGAMVEKECRLAYLSPPFRGI
ncbi:hypothetical protein C7N43_38245 [Sphingobacteriales bacterium UPWRP_1]|nr:hypothetical protein C7N43_38245 [Sphingobacteriales bacterium UPWRP_1]